MLYGINFNVIFKLIITKLFRKKLCTICIFFQNPNIYYIKSYLENIQKIINKFITL